MKLFLFAWVLCLGAFFVSPARAESTLGPGWDAEVNTAVQPQIDALQAEIDALKARVQALEDSGGSFDPQEILDAIAALDVRIKKLEDWAAGFQSGEIPDDRPIIAASDFGAIPDDGREDSGAIMQWLSECERRDVRCHVDAGLYQTRNLASMQLNGSVTIRGIERPEAKRAIFDAGGSAPKILFNVNADIDMERVGFHNFRVIFVGTPRPDKDQGGAGFIGSEALPWRTDLDHFRFVDNEVTNCWSVAAFITGGRTGSNWTTFSPDPADNPIIRNGTVTDNTVSDCGGGFDFALTRWGSSDGSHSWLIARNTVSIRNLLADGKCGAKYAFCGQAFEVGAHKAGWQDENGGLIFEDNDIGPILDDTWSGETQALRVQAGHNVVIRGNFLHEIACNRSDGIEPNCEGIYSKAQDGEIKGNHFRNATYYVEEAGAGAFKSGCKTCGVETGDGEVAPNGDGWEIHDNLIEWSPADLAVPSGWPAPVRSREMALAGIVADAHHNTFKNYPGFAMSCVGCNKQAKVLIRHKNGASTDHDNVIIP